MTIEIPLTQGKVAIIDDEDLPLVSGHKWYARKSKYTYYAMTNRNTEHGRSPFQMHTLLWNPPPGLEIDHIDGDGLNNTRANIRICTHAQNLQNTRKHAGCASQYKGVTWYGRDKKWTARIGKPHRHLGTFCFQIDAALAYDKAARELFGEFARTNF